MAVTMDHTRISPPDIPALITPLLSSLPGAALSAEPASSVLPLLSPILRQRVQLLSAGSKEPWIRLLTWGDASQASKLATIAQSGSLEAHPVSGEIEVDWDYDVTIRHKRLDRETLQTLVVLGEFDLFVRLVYCSGDGEGGGGEGWKVGEVGVASSEPSPLESFGGYPSLTEAEDAFKAASVGAPNGNTKAPVTSNEEEEEDDDDDDYWARYDATPARTPAVKRSPAPQQSGAGLSNFSIGQMDHSQSAEDAYYAQYDSVQPAMDNHDPDEAEALEEEVSPVVPPLGLARALESSGEILDNELGETSGAWTLAEPPRSPSIRSQDDENRVATLLHPRPASSAANSSSGGSLTVAKLEESAERREQAEFGVKQHISRSIRSLFLLSRASGIDREEFERMVKTELDVLGMVEDDI